MENDDNKCCICGIKLRKGEGRDPSPVKTEGKCCDMCAYEVVIPERARKFFREEK